MNFKLVFRIQMWRLLRRRKRLLKENARLRAKLIHSYEQVAAAHVVKAEQYRQQGVALDQFRENLRIAKEQTQ